MELFTISKPCKQYKWNVLSSNYVVIKELEKQKNTQNTYINIQNTVCNIE